MTFCVCLKYLHLEKKRKKKTKKDKKNHATGWCPLSIQFARAKNIQLPVVHHTQAFLVVLSYSLFQHCHYLLNKTMPTKTRAAKYIIQYANSNKQCIMLKFISNCQFDVMYTEDAHISIKKLQLSLSQKFTYQVHQYMFLQEDLMFPYMWTLT